MRRRGAVVLVDGAAGIGKTRLLHEVAACAARDGVEVLAGRGDQLYQQIALAPLLDALGAPVWGGAGLDGLSAELERRESAGPVLIVLDDLHWADPTTFTALHTITERLAHRRVAWVLARRDTGNPLLGKLWSALRDGGATRVELRPLSAAAAAEVAADVLGAPPGRGLARLVAGAGGNPSLLIGLLELLRDEEGVEVDGAHAVRSASSLPAGIASLARHHLHGVSAECRHLLEVAAVVGDAFAVGDVAKLMSRTTASVLPLLREAFDADVVRECDERIEFRHPVVRRALVECIPGPVRTELRREVHELLTGPVDLRCHRASSALAAGLVDEAMAEARQVLATPGTARHGRLTAQRVLLLALVLRGEFAEARTLAERLRDELPSDAVTLTGLAMIELAGGNPSVAAQLAERVVEIGPDAHLRWMLAQCLPGIDIPGVPSGHPFCDAALAAHRARRLLRTGQHREAVREAQAAVAATDARPWVGPALAVLATAAIREGEVHSVKFGDWAFVAETWLGAVQCQWATTLLTEARGGPIELSASSLLLADEPGAAAWQVRVALATDRVAEAEEIVRVAESLTPGSAAATHARGLLDRDAGALATAADRHEDPWESASAAEDLGALTGEVDALETANKTYSRIGAVRDAARVRRRLRAFGVRHRHWTYRDRATSGWDCLTETQRTAAELVARGLSNREVADQMFLSPHTVAFHLRKVFQVLGVRSRVELARLVAQRAG
ncbi:hypothetical protein Lesp02_35200 [Lentzea sp. NBRC 105346]|nr:hypothetical protein Lesp02_35200 [Lentzea sp. NBRC 105346]